MVPNHRYITMFCYGNMTHTNALYPNLGMCNHLQGILCVF
uniref:Uncharacterized protein n=1 Tax=Anguilla anguilla TaxID=7936 RepID=A0A0E9UID2_ANGAN